MDFQFLSPVDEVLFEEISFQGKHTLGSQIRIHSINSGIPDLKNIEIAIVGVTENRLDNDRDDDFLNFNNVRRSFYSLFPGNWNLKIADLGDIQKGETVEDTYFALS